MPIAIVAEEDPTIRRHMTRLLVSAGFSVRQVGTGTEALRMIQSSPPDLLVASACLPAMDGVELVRRASPFAPAMSTLLVTGFSLVPVAAAGSGRAPRLSRPLHLRRLGTEAARMVGLPLAPASV